jgi:hypothetical protein
MFHQNTEHTPVVSDLSLCVILEAFQVIISEHGDAHGSALGVPQISQIIDGALAVHHSYLETSSSSVEHLECLLRWHTLCMDLATDTILLCQRLCTIVGLEQKIIAVGRSLTTSVDLGAWVSTEDARRALLHAFTIQDHAEALDLGRSYPAHLPASLFAAAAVYFAFSKFGPSNVTAPSIPDWNAAWGTRRHNAQNLTTTQLASSDSYSFVKGYHLATEKTKSRNIHYSLLTLRMLLQTVSLQWGVAYDMLDILSTWIDSVES